MSDEKKFIGMKEKLIIDNERQYGREIREKYGDAAVNHSNEKLRKMTQTDFTQITQLGDAVIDTLQAALATGDPSGALAQKAADLHRQWLSYYWDQYTPSAHAGVTQMYVEDERFKAYYDKYQSGLAEFLRDAVLVYTANKRND